MSRLFCRVLIRGVQREEREKERKLVIHTQRQRQQHTCTICMENKNDIRLSCGHEYCGNCIQVLYLGPSQNTCPLCRAPFTMLSVRRIRTPRVPEAIVTPDESCLDYRGGPIKNIYAKMIQLQSFIGANPHLLRSVGGLIARYYKCEEIHYRCSIVGCKQLTNGQTKMTRSVYRREGIYLCGRHYPFFQAENIHLFEEPSPYDKDSDDENDWRYEGGCDYPCQHCGDWDAAYWRVENRQDPRYEPEDGIRSALKPEVLGHAAL